MHMQVAKKYAEELDLHQKALKSGDAVTSHVNVANVQQYAGLLRSGEKEKKRNHFNALLLRHKLHFQSHP